MHPDGPSLASYPFVNSLVGSFLDHLLASLSRASSSNPGLLAVPFGFSLFLMSYLLVCCVVLLSVPFVFTFSRPLHGLF